MTELPAWQARSGYYLVPCDKTNNGAAAAGGATSIVWERMTPRAGTGYPPWQPPPGEDRPVVEFREYRTSLGMVSALESPIQSRKAYRVKFPTGAEGSPNTNPFVWLLPGDVSSTLDPMNPLVGCVWNVVTTNSSPAPTTAFDPSAPTAGTQRPYICPHAADTDGGTPIVYGPWKTTNGEVVEVDLDPIRQNQGP